MFLRAAADTDQMFDPLSVKQRANIVTLPYGTCGNHITVSYKEKVTFDCVRCQHYILKL